MRVEIWSDVICPWCGLGQHRLEQALAAFEHRDDVEVVHRSFQLDPSAPSTVRPVADMLAAKGFPIAQLKAMTGRVESLAAADGLTPYFVGDNVVANTRIVHEWLALASDRGLEDTAWKRIYKAYFGERKPIFDVESLVALGTEIGLEPTEVRAVLTDGRYRARVETEGREARTLGSSGVPFVVIDRRLAVAGAQPTATFLQALRQAWQANPTPLVAVPGDASCGPDGCSDPLEN